MPFHGADHESCTSQVTQVGMRVPMAVSKLWLAYRMIAHPRLLIGEILHHIGLGSHSTFSRSFRHFGLSASAVRAQRL